MADINSEDLRELRMAILDAKATTGSRGISEKSVSMPVRVAVALLELHDHHHKMANAAARLQTAASRWFAALVTIRDAKPWVGSAPEFGQGHDAARESAADIAREAIENEGEGKAADTARETAA